MCEERQAELYILSVVHVETALNERVHMESRGIRAYQKMPPFAMKPRLTHQRVEWAGELAEFRAPYASKLRRLPTDCVPYLFFIVS